METTRLSSKGQVVLPKSIRDARRLTPGTEFVVEDRPDGILLRLVARPFAATRVDDVLGCTGYRGPALSIEDMDAAIAAAARAEGAPPNADRDRRRGR
ncbi:MAG TPA: AbrB/MazE/SpoVT family DNA-binding domain-containing protein [Burkholderiaceae bacterium]|nr:AbrB/MazE/SpoVT family DNA-binding domain-containing protein [Burkholderiaceae bacterium]